MYLFCRSTVGPKWLSNLPGVSTYLYNFRFFGPDAHFASKLEKSKKLKNFNLGQRGEFLLHGAPEVLIRQEIIHTLRSE